MAWRPSSPTPVAQEAPLLPSDAQVLASSAIAPSQWLRLTLASSGKSLLHIELGSTADFARPS